MIISCSFFSFFFILLQTNFVLCNLKFVPFTFMKIRYSIMCRSCNPVWGKRHAVWPLKQSFLKVTLSASINISQLFKNQILLANLFIPFSYSKMTFHCSKKKKNLLFILCGYNILSVECLVFHYNFINIIIFIFLSGLWHLTCLIIYPNLSILLV